jgi:hypothetical protein
MAGNRETDSHEADEHRHGSEQPNPSGTSSQAPAEGDEETAPKQSGSPQG